MIIATALFMPLFSNHRQSGYRIKPINNEKLSGIKMDLPTYKISVANTIICKIVSTCDNLSFDVSIKCKSGSLWFLTFIMRENKD